MSSTPSAGASSGSHPLQVTALKLEFSALERKLLQRDATIAQLHADARAAEKAARQSAAKQGARIAALQRQLDAAPASHQQVRHHRAIASRQAAGDTVLSEAPEMVLRSAANSLIPVPDSLKCKV